MNIIELSCRGESVFLTKGDITGLIKEDWFLSVLIGADYLKPDNHAKHRVEINEDKNTVMSLIETMRYNSLIVLEGVSLDYMLALGEKWCLPDCFLLAIKERQDKLEKSKPEPGTKYGYNNVVFTCINCGTGFKESENTPTSCKYHRLPMGPGGIRFPCCGRHYGEEQCVVGYHSLSIADRCVFLKLKQEMTE